MAIVFSIYSLTRNKYAIEVNACPLVVILENSNLTRYTTTRGICYDDMFDLNELFLVDEALLPEDGKSKWEQQQQKYVEIQLIQCWQMGYVAF